MPNIFNIPASLNFLENLADGILQRFENIEEVTVLLPTRRSIFSLKKIFAQKGIENMPKIEPLGDLEKDNLFLKNIAEIKATPKAISKTERITRLAKLIENKFDEKTLYESMTIAKRLVSLIDEMQNKGTNFKELENIVAEEFAEQWQLTLNFLEVITKDWQAYKLQNNILEPVERRNKISALATNYFKENPIKKPIIIAGTTGSVPATLELVKSIANSPKGYLLLRGCDVSFSDDEYKHMPENHPQFNLSNLLNSFQYELSNLEAWHKKQGATQAEKLVSTAMLPVSKIEEWQNFDSKNAEDNFKLIQCEDSEEEAMVIAMIIREALENNSGSINIICNNNRLTKKLKAKCEIWNIEINDSSGGNLAKQNDTEFFLSLAEMCANDFSAIKFLSFFKHQLAPQELAEKAIELEKTELRGLSLNEFYPWKFEIEIEGLEAFWKLFKLNEIPFFRVFSEHIKLAKTISGEEFISDELQDFFELTENTANFIGNIDPLQYITTLRELMSQNIIWPEFDDNFKVNILTSLEARLLNSELTIFADCNDGTMPELPKGDGFLNQNMRASLGLDSADRRVGQQAHDFEMLSKNGNVIYTRAQKSGGSPTQKSRFLESITALVKLDDGAKYKHWAKQFYTPQSIVPCAQPAPIPPLESRPKQLSVTKIGQLMRDPYVVYASKILNLKKLDEIDKEISPSDFGNFVHAAIENYFEGKEGGLSALHEAGKFELEKYKNKLAIETFWWPRFEKIASWIIAQKQPDAEIKHEIWGSYKIEDFEIIAKADRLEINNKIKVMDYKTGAVPRNEDVLLGLDPQLPLEAIIFSKQTGKQVEALEFWSIKGNANEDEKIISVTCDDIAELVINASDGVEKLLKKFNNPNTPYIANPRPSYALKYNDYEHLSRNKEWDS